MAMASSNVWERKEKEFSAQGNNPEKLAFLPNHAILVPSRLNAQLWLFRIADGVVELREPFEGQPAPAMMVASPA